MARPQGVTELEAARSHLREEQRCLFEARKGGLRIVFSIHEQRVLAALSWLHDAQERAARNRIWKCRDGREIAIRDMKPTHLMNCIALIKRCSIPAIFGGGSWREEYLDDLMAEFKRRRGD